ncbi:MAG: trypsin-like peptidase domain-containing protein [Bacteroidales bacterium]|nr:trypsin-like peptidase domain-containing protein [Bacteroidales bacterium]
MKRSLTAYIFCTIIVSNAYAQNIDGDMWASTYNDALQCNIPAICNEEHNDISRATCRIYVNGQELGTGTLVNNTALDRKPYVLTSAHILSDLPSESNTISEDNITFLFGYEEPTCSGIICNHEIQKIKGATIIAYDKRADMALLLMSESPSVACRPYWAGWSINTSPIGPYTCFHHPKGDAKKVSVTENITPNCTHDLYDNNYYEENFWRVNGFYSGLVEKGSSGSALTDNDGRIIGALTGGNAANCDIIDELIEYYWMLGKAWNATDEDNGERFITLAEALAPDGSGTTSLDGLDFVTSDSRECKQFKSYTNDSDVQEASKTFSSTLSQLRQAIDIEADSIEIWSMRFATYDATCSNVATIAMGIASDEDAEPTFANSQRAIYLTKVIDSDSKEYERYENILEFNFDEPIKISTNDAYVYVKVENLQDEEYVTPAFVASDNVINEAQWLIGSTWKANNGFAAMIDIIYSELKSDNQSQNPGDNGTVTNFSPSTHHNDITYRKTTDGVLIESEGLRTIKIYDIEGHLISTCNAEGESLYFIDFNDLYSGIYIINAVATDGTSRSMKTIITH